MKRVTVLIAVLALFVAQFAVAGGQGEEAAEGEETEYRIGIVFDVGGRGDRSFNDSAYNGLRQLAEEYNGYIADDPDDVDFGNRIELKYLEPREGGQDREQLMRVMAEDGYGLIFGVGFAFTDVIEKVASDFPDTHFGLIDGFVPELDEESNITSITFAEHEGSFLVGALAGMFAEDLDVENPKVGFIGGMDSPLIHRFGGGFTAGAVYANENLRDEDMILNQYIGQDPTAFSDPQTANDIAENMYGNGAEIVYHAAGASGSGLFNAAQDQGKWAIGVDADQGQVLAASDSAEEQAMAEHILTSMLKRVDNSVFLLSQEYIENDGEVDGGYTTYGLDDDGVGVAVNEYNEDLVSPYMDLP
ncbi:MAG: BMP family ABC transporter substrate-binding protein, partial [Planctomycetes bacterium]|nr:BMP family ABC transporter substrate-binding protein [Planctomycetota bacterium]